MHSTTLGAIITSFALLATPVFARGPWAGGLDIIEACHMQYGPTATVAVVENTAWGWRCVVAGQYYDVDTNRYCGDKYGHSAQSDPQGGGPYDWGCYYP